MMFADYFKEKDGKETVEIENGGFMTYIVRGDECYIEHVYVVPEKRKSGIASDLLMVVEAAALEKGCKYVTGSVRPSANGSTASLKALLAVGFRLLSAANDAIYFVKELEHG